MKDNSYSWMKFVLEQGVRFDVFVEKANEALIVVGSDFRIGSVVPFADIRRFITVYDNNTKTNKACKWNEGMGSIRSCKE